MVAIVCLLPPPQTDTAMSWLCRRTRPRGRCTAPAGDRRRISHFLSAERLIRRVGLWKRVFVPQKAKKMIDRHIVVPDTRCLRESKKCFVDGAPSAGGANMYQNQNEHCIGADSTLICAVLVTVAILFVTDIAMADYGEVLYHQKISDTEGGFTGELGNGDWFGIGTAPLGDLDGDGVGDLAVGAVCDDDGGNGHGAVWILFLNTDGTIKSHQKISDTEGGFTGELDDWDQFGHVIACLGDLDDDGVVDLAVSAPRDDDGGEPPDADRGAVWILFLNNDGTVDSHQKISDTEGGFTGTLDVWDAFGRRLASIEDLDGDGVTDLAAAAYDDDGGTDRGAVWLLFLNADGTVKCHQKISSTQGGFDGPLDDGDCFGFGLAFLGDQNGDGVGDLAVGARLDDDGGTDRGAV